MTALRTVQQELPVDAVSIVRLHGEACIECGSTKPPLSAAGHIGTRTGKGDGIISWPVVTCPAHTEGQPC